MFTLGNISALIATCFLVGPKAQLTNMTTKERMGSAAAFVVAMLATLVVSVHVRPPAGCAMHLPWVLSSVQCIRIACNPIR